MLATNDIKLQSVKPPIKAKGIELSNWLNTNHKIQKAFVLTKSLLYGVQHSMAALPFGVPSSG
jgi:hypothetical protein